MENKLNYPSALTRFIFLTMSMVGGADYNSKHFVFPREFKAQTS